MRIPNFCLPGHAGAELVNLPMSLSSVGLQQTVTLQRPRGCKEGAGVCRREWIKQKRRQRGREEGGSSVIHQK